MGLWQRIRLAWAVFRAATPNNPSFNMNDPAAWDAYFHGDGESSSGVNVTRDKALSNAAWWRGINMIARDVGKLPLFTYARNGEGKDRATDHASYRLLRYKPNAWQTALQFRMQLTGHALDEGNGYGYIVRRGDAKPAEILPLDPCQTWPLKVNGRLWYATRIDLDNGRSEDRKLPAEDVLHIKGLGFDGMTGYPCRKMAQEDLGLAIGQRKYSSVYFKNDATPGIVFEAPGPMPRDAVHAFLREWNKIQSGLDNKHKAAVATHGMKASKLAYNARESQLTEGRAMQVREIATFLGVPPHKLGDNSRTAYASLEQENLSYLVDCLDFWLCVWESECWDKLLTEEEKEADSHVVEFLRQALVRADLTSRANYYRTALGGRPWMVPDEVRGLENQNPKGGTFAEALDPLNMTPGGQKPAGAAPPRKDDEPPVDDDEEDADAKARDESLRATLRENFADACRRMVRRVGHDAERAAKDAKGFMAWLDTFTGDHQGVVREATRLPFSALCQFHGSTISDGDACDWLLATIRNALFDVSGQATAQQLPEHVAAEMSRLEATLPAQAVEIYDQPE